MTFNELNLNKPLISALDDLGYINPTPIQEKAFPVIMSGKDVVAIAQTGTGKTFAYLLPMLRQLKYSEKKHPRILIVVPTRELVLQIVREIEKLTSYMNVRYQGVYGGTNINTQKQLVYDGLDILVATPGRLVDLALTGLLRLKDIQKLVIDEVDQMLSLGFRQQLISFLETLPAKRQNLMFSATMTEDVEKVIAKYFHEPFKIEIAAHGTPLDKIIQKGYHVPNFHTKVNLLEYLLNDVELSKVLVFVENKKLADRLFELLEKKIIDQVGVIHSSLSQNNRISALKNFHDGRKRVLIATDIIARGLDISDVTHVINFDTSRLPEDYIHRIGRTGRANKAGVAISFINEAEQEYQFEIENLMNKEIPIEPFPAAVQISKVYTEEEKPSIIDKNIKRINAIKIPIGQGAFHEKKEKNKKVNLGGPSVLDPKKGKSTRKDNSKRRR
ncbi:MAG: DEAD/DEAH box helicase [Bacteroidetes bacterium]|nr:DEAD/DEAH box helicase [Bacteroidota bacterium]